MDQSNLRTEGIRGWLFLFCLSLTVLGPLMTFGQLANLYYQMGQFFHLDNGLRGAFTVYALTSIGLTIFGAYAGFGMWRKQVAGLNLAKLFLVGAMAFAWISPFIWIIGVEKAEFSKVMGSFLGSAVGVTIVCLIWYAYLNKSKRVRAIYLSSFNGSANMKRTLAIIAALAAGGTVAGAVAVWALGTLEPKSPAPRAHGRVQPQPIVPPRVPTVESEYDLSCVIPPGGIYPRDCVDMRGTTSSPPPTAPVKEQESSYAHAVAEAERKIAEQAKRERQREIQEAVEAGLVKDSLLRPRP